MKALAVDFGGQELVFFATHFGALYIQQNFLDILTNLKENNRKQGDESELNAADSDW